MIQHLKALGFASRRLVIPIRIITSTLPGRLKLFLFAYGALIVGAIFFWMRLSAAPEYVPLAAVIRDNYVPMQTLKDRRIDAKAHGSGGTLGISVAANQTEQARAALEETWRQSHFFMTLSSGHGRWKHYDETRVDSREYQDPLWNAFTHAANEATIRHYSMGQAMQSTLGR